MVLEINQKKKESKDLTRLGKNAKQNTKDTLNILINEQSKDEWIKVRTKRQNNNQYNKHQKEQNKQQEHVPSLKKENSHN